MTHDDLKAAIAEFLNRQDLTAIIPTFITLAEASMNRKLRHWRMEKRSTAFIDTRYSAVPADWLETIQFDVKNGTNAPMRLIGHADMSSRQSETPSGGRPCFYALTGCEFEFYPTPDAEYEAELVYYASLDSLSDTTSTNWLLAYAPDAYLYGALIHSAPYLQEDTRVQVWGSMYQSIIQSLNDESSAAKYSGTGLRMKIGAK